MIDTLFWLDLFVTIGYCFWLTNRCEHKYSLDGKIKLYPSGDSTNMPSAFLYISKCEKCGKIKQQRISG